MIREAEIGDVEGILHCLGNLSDSPYSEQVKKAFEERLVCGNIFTYVAVGIDFDSLDEEGCIDNKTQVILGTISIILERKLSHNGGLVAHIEDVSVLSTYQGKGLGKSLMEFGIEFAKQAKCYKIILNCSNRNVEFYERLGFKVCDNGMRFDL